MMRVAMTAAAIAFAIAPTLIAQRRSTPATATKTSTAATCASEVGNGVSTKRRFCDVLIAQKGADSVQIPVPAHRGTTTLKFDLHNRFTVPASNQTPVQAFARHVAVIAVVSQTGEVIDRATATAEFRKPADLFDLIAGASPAGVKAIGPGHAESYTITVPANVTAIGLIGLWLDSTTSRGRELFDTPGRPVALVSGIKVEYTPLR